MKKYHVITGVLPITLYANTGITVSVNGIPIFTGTVNAPSLSTGNVSSASTKTVFSFEHDDINFYVSASFSLFGIEYEVSSSSPSPPLPTLEIVQPVRQRTTPSSMPAYVPILKYTNTAISVFQAILKEANKPVIPLLDIRKDGEFQGYIKDACRTKHFLDICDLQIMRNREYRENIKAIRRKRRKDPTRPKLPDEEYTPATYSEIINKYVELSRIFNIIPTIRVNTGYPATTEERHFIAAMGSAFKTVLFRVLDMENFQDHIGSYLEAFSGDLSGCYVMMEFNGVKIRSEQPRIEHLLSLAPGVQLIYTKETADYENIKIDYGDNTFENIALSGYKRMRNHLINELWFSDYCGYDRNTAVEFIPGMTPSARLYLLDNIDAKRIYILKVKVDSERGTQKTKESFKYLLAKIIRKDAVNTRYLDKNHCDACEEIYTAESLALASAKTASFKHNGITIARL